MERQVSVEREIAAPAQRIFDVLADPRMHPHIDGSGTVKSAISGPDRLAEGDKFGMRMRIGLPYLIRNVVVEFDEGRRIAWRHVGRHVWRYELEPRDGSTLVRETFDWSGALSHHYIEWMGFPERHRPAMARTLERLEELVVGS
jgi:uncharacterized protein YndB with AHSA1/START domain